MAADDLLSFLVEVDAALVKHAGGGETLDMHLLGRAAMILGNGVRLMTKDVDIVDVAGSRLLRIAVAFFCKGGPGHSGRGFYLETVSSGLPPLPTGYQSRCIDGPGFLASDPAETARGSRPGGDEVEAVPRG